MGYISKSLYITYLSRCIGIVVVTRTADIVLIRDRPIDIIFFEIDNDIFKKVLPIFGQFPIFDWRSMFQNLLTDIFAVILTKYFG